ncbi:MAG: TIGR02679 family protein [Rhodococcus sp. (in: high G+C Gram-positive bacteria)]|uniref:TIGR02679 family protein n=1 Tax=Rhodococcus sp. TaxID=1831 RepID=UPI003BB10060
MNDWNGTPELELLLAAARRRLENNWLLLEGDVPVTASPDAPNLWRLCRAIRGGKAENTTKKMRVPLTLLDDWLQKPMNGGLPLAQRLAPLDNKKLSATETEAYKHHYWPDELRRRLGSRTDERWLDWLSSTGKLVQPSYFPALRHAPSVLELLPADGISLTELAERATGDTKALDRKRLLAPIVLYALALEQGTPRPRSIEAERTLWESHGVVVDTLSSQVMVLGVRVHEEHLLGRFLNEAAQAGLPFVLTLDQLARYTVTPTPGPVFVCENPAVLAAAARTLGARCPALICTQGQPSAAAGRLLERFSAQPVHWRGDFDWTGLRTTAAAIDRYNAQPWLMDSETYRTAAGRGPSESFKDSDCPYDAAWDTELTPLMKATGNAVMEERIIPELLAFLRAVSTSHPPTVDKNSRVELSHGWSSGTPRSASTA